MKKYLRSGIPSKVEYKLLLESAEFHEMEMFSTQFLANHRSVLARFAKKWVSDPLHQWSRQWEYPFVFGRIESSLTNTGKPRILDAGSGVTFFPYYLKQKINSAEVYCCDSDESLEAIYRVINGSVQSGVEFTRADMRKLPFQDDWFDAVYCISVLEHTDNYEEIIDDFHRVLTPGGKLIVTFDISLDGTRDISIERAAKLIDALNKKFDSDDPTDDALKTDLSNPDIFTTLSAREIDANLLPWKYPAIIYRVRAMMTGKTIGNWPPLLSAYCLSLTKSRT